MQRFTINESQNNKKIVQVITSKYPNVSISAIYKALRQKDIKVNGGRIKEDVKVENGDYVEIYISDDILNNTADVSLVYEDKNLLIVNKPQGLKVHPDKEDDTKSLVEILTEKYGEEIGLCHRLDRNTGGLIIAAKNKEAISIITEKIKNNEITKVYRCMVHGKLSKKHEELTAFHNKDAKNSLVYIKDEPSPGASKIITVYDLISYDKGTDISIADITLITGKTHQIRAHMAYIGHPVVGDGKYGSNELKRKLGQKHKYQKLYAYKLVFAFKTDAGIMNYMKNELIAIDPLF